MFKTIESDASLTGKKITSIFGTTASSIKAAFNSNAKISIVSALDSDTQSVENYKAAIDSGKTSQEAFNATMLEASQQAQDYIHNTNTSQISARGFQNTVAQNQVVLQAQNKSLGNVRALINEYNTGCASAGNICRNTGLAQKDFASSVGKSNALLGNQLSGLNGAKASMGKYVGSIAAAKAATIGLQASTMALNTVLGLGVGAVLTLAATFISAGWDKIKYNLSSTEEKIESLDTKMAELSDTIQSSTSNYVNFKTNATDVISRFTELSKGVDNLGNNLSLTGDEYDEFWKLNNQIADLFPELSMGLDENGNHMLDLSYCTDTLTESLNKLMEAQRLEAAQAAASKLPELVDTVVEKTNLLENEKNYASSRVQAYNKVSAAAQKGDAIDGEYSAEIRLAFNAGENEESWTKLVNKYKDLETGLIDWNGIFNSNEMKNAIAGAEREAVNSAERIGNTWNSLKSATSAWLETDYVFQGMDKQAQTTVKNIVNSLDFSALGYNTAEEIQSFISDSILGPINLAAPEIQDAFSKFFKTGYDSTDLDSVNKKIKEAKTLMSNFLDEDGKVDLTIEGAEAAQEVFANLIYQKQSLNEETILQVDASQVEGEVGDAISKLQEFIGSYNELEVQTLIGADTTEAENKCNELLKEVSGLNPEILTALGIKTGNIEELRSSIENIDPSMLVNVDKSLVDQFKNADHSTEGTVTWSNLIGKVTAWMSQRHGAEGEVDWENDTSNVRTNFWATGIVNWVNSIFNGGDDSEAQGTAHSQGTAYAEGNAFARGKKGNWGTKRSGVALGGEIGPEIVVRNGKFFTIGEDSAEFFRYKKNDIIFNAEQTRQILKNGKIANGKKRGVTYANGTAYSTGTAFAEGTAYAEGTDEEVKLKSVDWIAISIDRIARAVEKLKNIANSTYKSLKTRLGATYDEIKAVNKEISVQQKAYKKYSSEADKVELSDSLKKKVQDGSISITEYDEETQELINSYQDLYEKALDASDAVEELHEELASLYEDNFNNISDDYDNQLELLSHLENTYETGLDALEAKGYLASKEYYSSLESFTRKKSIILKQELYDLEKSFNEAMASGEIEKNSEAWYQMQSQINDTKEAIAEANVELLEYAKTMRELEWEYFDYEQDRISQLTQEADFMIDLMSSKKMNDDNGNLTKEGLATAGLHAENYNIYMAQADKYAAEILKLDKEIANDPYNTDLIERREELLELQQKSILSAEDEKEAIADLIEDGIQQELNAMKDLIDTYNDSLDSAKSLYEYQKKIKEQTTNISNIQKQLSAYQNDNSEETRTIVQKLKVELADAQEELKDTEYDQYISDQKKLLDELYSQYEIQLNERMDNVDVLVEEMINTVNTNSDSINGTLTSTADSVGYTMSENMQSIWSSANDVVTTYGDGFSEKLTSINSVLNSISANVAAMVGASDEEANATTSSAKAITKPTTSTATTEKKTTENKTTTTTKAIKVGGKINAKGAKIYSYAGDTNGLSQYYSDDPVYTVLKEEDGYLQVRHHKLSSGITGWFKKKDVKAYKRGGLVDYTGLAQVDGTKSRPESFLDAQDTENINNLKNLLREMSKKNLTFGLNDNLSSIKLGNLFGIQNILPAINKNISNGIGSNIGEINITIPIDHVDNYNDFITQLQKDGQFEKFIQSMTIDRAVGGSSLAKNKYKWK